MEINKNTLNKIIIECLINRSLFEITKTNIDGFYKFNASHNDLGIFGNVLDYINSIEYDEFSSINLANILRKDGTSEGTVGDLTGNIDYLRSVNSDKAINPESVSYLKEIFYSGHYESVRNKPYDEIFEYCRSVQFIANYQDPRFVIQDISTNIDVDKIVSLLSPKDSIKSSFQFINESSPNKGYFPNELVTISAAPGVGKTQFCFTEALEFIKQGKRVIYIALGDMVDYMVVIRLMCMHLRVSPMDAYMDLPKYLSQFLEDEDIKNNFKFVILKSNEVTSTEVFNFLSVMKNTYDVFMVDYDGNFRVESDRMYQEGGATYDNAINLCREYNKLGFILSQPKIGYWHLEALGKECLAESSRKQQITDTIITFGCRQGAQNRCGLTQVVKGRNRDLVFRVPWVAADSGQSVQIDQDMYGELINAEKKMKILVNEQGTLDLPDRFLDSEDLPY